MMRNMPMTKRQLKAEMKSIEKRERILQESLNTEPWLGVAYAHIPYPKSSIGCRIAYRLSRIFSKAGPVSR